MSDRYINQLNNVDLRLLRVFRKVVESGGLSAAEQELNIGRSTISKHVKDLEERLGFTLALRGRSGFSLTAEGAHIYDATLQLLGAIDSFRIDILELHKQLQGHLNLAFFDKTATNPNANISAAFAKFDDEAPDATLDIHVAPLNEIERGVLDGRFHLGIVPGLRDTSLLEYIPLFTEDMGLFAASNHRLFTAEDKITIKQVMRYKYAGLGYHSPNMKMGQELALQRAATVYDQETIVQLVLSGRYLGYLPNHYAAYWIEKGDMKQVDLDSFKYQCDFFVVVPKQDKHNRLLTCFLAALRAVHG